MNKVTVNVKISGEKYLMNRFAVEDKLGTDKGFKSAIPSIETMLYRHPVEKYIYVPCEQIKAAMLKAGVGKVEKFAGKKVTWWKLVASFVSVKPDAIKIMPQEWTNYTTSGINHNCKPPARIITTRPRFDDWSLEFQLVVDDIGLPMEKLREILENAGQYEGIGNWRPNLKGDYGKFEIVKWEIV